MRHQPARILVVDDEPAIRFTLKCLLERSGHVVTTAGDGIEALEVLAHDAFDLLLLDVKLPGMSGVALAQRAADLQPTAAVLLLTGTEALGSERRDAVEGFACLYKTASPQEVLTRIAALLAGSELRSVSA